MSGDQQNKAPEATPEDMPEREDLDLADLESGGRAIGENSNQDSPEMCKLLNPEIPLDKQTDRVALLRGAMVNIVAKLMKEGVPVEVLAKKPEMLCQLVAAKELPLETDEQVALSNINFLLNQNGAVPAYFRDSTLWQGIIDEAGSLFKAPRDHFNGIYQEYPVATKAVIASLAVGMGFLGYKFFMADDKEKAQEKEGMSAAAKVAIALGGVAAVAYFAGDSIKDYLKDSAKNNTFKSLNKNETLASLKKELSSEKKTYSDSLEKRPLSNTLVIGDSIASGLANKAKINRNFDFIGRSGRTSSQVLAEVRQNKDKFANKEVVIINVGGNDITKTNLSPEQIAENIRLIAQECKDMGVENVIVLARFPYDPRLRQKWGDRLDGYKQRSKALRDSLIKKDNTGEIKADVVDLYEPFADAEGYLKEAYLDEKGGDFLHPKKAYGVALELIELKVGKDRFVRRLSSGQALS